MYYRSSTTTGHCLQHYHPNGRGTCGYIVTPDEFVITKENTYRQSEKALEQIEAVLRIMGLKGQTFRSLDYQYRDALKRGELDLGVYNRLVLSRLLEGWDCNCRRNL